MSVTIQEQITPVAPDIFSIVPQVPPVAADVREVSSNIRSTAISEIAAEVAPVSTQVDTIATNIEPVCSDISSIGSDVRPMSVPAGRGRARSEFKTDNHGSGSESDHDVASHGLFSILRAPDGSTGPIMHARAEPILTAGFRRDSST